MANEIDIVVSAEETASAELDNVADAATRTSNVVVRSMGDAEDAFDTAVRESGNFGAAMDKLEGGAGTLAEGIDGVGQVVQGVSDIMSYSERRAENLARAHNDVAQSAQDVEQAVEDMAQAERDASQADQDAEQAGLDLAQANLDRATAQKELNKAIKEHGKNSDEAKQAALDLRQANLDVSQAEEDKAQALRDSKQATLDSKQATIDHKTASDELTASQRELATQSGIMSQVSEWAGMLSGVLGGLVGIIGAVAAIQWVWNAALLASPLTWIIAGILLLVGVIVLIATKTDWFQRLWKAIWSKIGDPVKNTWKWIKDTTSSFVNWIGKVPGKIGNFFKSVGNAISAPFRAAFNAIASGWNSTVGGFGFTVPSWVPGVGGNSFSIPSMSRLAVGGDVLKSGLAYIHAGERINTAAQTQRLPYDHAGSPSSPSELKISLEVYGNPQNAYEAAMLDLLQNNVRVKAVIDTGIRDTVKNNGNGSVQTAYGKRGMG